MAHVLLVDDDGLVRASEAEFLERAGYVVHTAGTAVGAREVWSHISLDVAVLDLVLPGQGGIEALGELNRACPDVAVILQTGYASLDTAVQALRSGASDYLIKPVPPPVLVEAVRRGAERAHRLRQTRQRLASSERLTSLGVLAAGIAHEINNPIASVVSNLQTFQRYAEEIQAACGPLDDARARAPEPDKPNPIRQVLEDLAPLLNDALEGCGRVTSIINGLRAYAKGDTSRKSRFDLKPILEETLRLAQGRLQQVCDVTSEFSWGAELQGNAVQIQEVFLNMLVNAAHAIEATGRRGGLRVSIFQEPRWVGFDVVDDGCGIRPDHLGHIFDPFFTTKSPGEGTGLGLSISHAIVQGHGGEIRVESAPGRGSRFMVRLPRAPQLRRSIAPLGVREVAAAAA